MSPLAKSLLVFVGAGLGGNLRYWIGGWVSGRTTTAFPWGTFVVNLSGCLLIGLVAGFLLTQEDPTPWRLLLLIGVLGGYTTFSTFSLETLHLLSDRSYLYALVNVLASCIVGFAATWFGLTVTRWVTRS